MAVTVQTLQERKANQEKFSCLTAYDATFASLLSECGIDVILVGTRWAWCCRARTAPCR